MTNEHRLARWRLILGADAEAHGIGCGDDANAQRIEKLVGFLFQEGGCAGDSAQRGDPTGGGERSDLTVPEWVDQVNELFPNQAKEVLQRELIQRRGIKDLMEKSELLEKIEPNLELVKTLLTHKDLLNPKTRVLARKIIDKVVRELKEKLKVQVEPAITGAIRRDRHSPRRVFRNLDLKTTLRRNLHNFHEASGKLLVDRMFFHAAERKNRPWHIIVTVDQSGSMLESTVFSAVMASIFAELPALRTSLVMYDTRVVDLSDKIREPIDVLMTVQLGGGNDTALALQYVRTLIRQPARTICVLISDFYEGEGERRMILQIREMLQAGVRMIGLGALGMDARPFYNKPCATKLRKEGMDVLVCTPEKLAECMAEIIRG
jgi:Mg-chelatase subunit ChlD